MKFNINKKVLSVLLFFVSLDLFTSEFYFSTQTINTSSPYYKLLCLWEKTSSSGTIYEATSMAVDRCGNICIVGVEYYEDAFVAKYDPQGNLLWKYTFDDTEWGVGISVDKDNNIYVIGSKIRIKSVWFDDYSILIKKLSPEGSEIWTREYNTLFPYHTDDYGRAITVGPDGYIYAIGELSRYVNGLETDWWLAKLDSEGNWISTSTFSSESIYGEEWNNIAVDSSGNIYIVGESCGENGGITVWKYDNEGTIHKWIYPEEAGGKTGWDIEIDTTTGCVYVIGENWYDLSNDIVDIRLILLKYDVFGNLLSVYEGLANEYSRGYGLVFSPNGKYIYAVGDESTSIWIGKFDLDLNNIWNATCDWFDGVGYSVAVDSQGNICVVGTVNKFGYGDIWVGKFKEEYVGSESNLSGRFSKTTYLTEDLRVEKFTIDGKVNGDLTGDFNFDELVFVKITTGTFANKSISRGSFTITLDGVKYSGVWKGMGYISKNKFYINGVVSGQINGVVEGCVSETNEVYDLCEATWTLNQIGEETTSAKIFLSGKLNLKNTEDYPSTNLCLLQTSFEGVNTGRYYSGNLDCVLSCLKIVSESNPYYNSGIAIISYNSLNGSGNIYGYAETISSITKIEGIADSAVFGYFYGLLDESVEPKKLSVSILPVDIGKLPQPNLKIKIFGPERVSPGETITYTVELRNYGLKQAEDITVVALPPTFTEFVSASDDYIYFTIAHWEDPENWQTSRVWQVPRVRWDFQTVPAKSTKILTVQVKVKWGTPFGKSEKPQVWLMPKKTADEFFPKYDPYGDHD
jgi:uncharacterized repeat protein (TIGR01451 family)